MNILNIVERDDGGAIMTCDLSAEELSIFVNVGINEMLREYIAKENTKRFDE